jgi:hypothetical protein
VLARVLRGGSWNNHARNLRAAVRNRNAPDNRNNNLGLRLASPPERPRAAVPPVLRLPMRRVWRRVIMRAVPGSAGSPGRKACHGRPQRG